MFFLRPTQHPSPPFPFPCRPGFVTHLEKLLFSFPIKHLPALEVRVDLLSSAPLKSFTRLPVGPARRSRDPGPARRRGAACSFCMGGCRHVEIPSATFFLHCTRSHSSSSLSVWLSHQSIQISEKENDEVIAWRPSIFLGRGKGRGGEGGGEGIVARSAPTSRSGRSCRCCAGGRILCGHRTYLKAKPHGGAAEAVALAAQAGPSCLLLTSQLCELCESPTSLGLFPHL